MANTFYLDDTKLDIKITVTESDGVTARPIDDSTLLEYLFVKPDGTTSIETPVFDSDGTDGKLKFTIPSGFLDQKGKWCVRARVTQPAAGPYKTAILEFEVEP